MKKSVITILITMGLGVSFNGCNKKINVVKQEEPQSYSKITQPSKQICNGKSASECNTLGVLYTKGKGVPQDYSKASQIFEKACASKSALGCNNLGILYYKGKGVKKDESKARKFYKKACDYGDSRACLSYKILDLIKK